MMLLFLKLGSLTNHCSESLLFLPSVNFGNIYHPSYTFVENFKTVHAAAITFPPVASHSFKGERGNMESGGRSVGSLPLFSQQLAHTHYSILFNILAFSSFCLKAHGNKTVEVSECTDKSPSKQPKYRGKEENYEAPRHCLDSQPNASGASRCPRSPLTAST